MDEARSATPPPIRMFNKAGRVEFTAIDAEDLTIDAGLVAIPTGDADRRSYGDWGSYGDADRYFH